MRTRSPYAERGDTKIRPLDFTLTRLFGAASFRFNRHAAKLASRIRLVEESAPLFADASDDDLASAARQLRGPLLRHGFRSDLVARSFALVREATWRKLKLRHYPVQLQGAWAMLDGMFVEMETLGPLATLAKSQSVTHVEHWSLEKNISLKEISDSELDRVFKPLMK